MPNRTLIVPLFAGILAHTALAVFVVFLHRYADVDIIKIWVGPFPFISFFIAFIASFAFFFGLDEKSLIKTDYIYLAFCMNLFSICGISLIYFLEYQTAWFADGLKVSNIMTFTDFLKFIFSSSSSIKMFHQQDVDAIQFDQMRYLLPSFECLAYIFGGSLIGFGALRTKD